MPFGRARPPLKLRRSVVLAAIVSLAGQCQRRTAPGSDAPAAGDEHRATLGEVCEATCARLAACPADAVDTQAFAFDCSASCPSAAEPASRDATRLLDCARLDSCTAFMSCAELASSDAGTEIEAEAAATPRSATVAAPDPCERVCHRASGCPDGPREIDSCVARCQNANDASTNPVLACQHQPTCDALLPCLAAARGPAGPLTPLGIDETCVQLCDRTRACGADSSELDGRQLRALSRDTQDVWMECAIQCTQEVRDDNRAAFDECLAIEPCDRFLKCADEL
ncbi:MAG: hypothetical protein B7733_07160 [Myxococcales bacterium FL481]|nr:MAG: hypothetical protein B7733_07160 [Myxococcales bacterium FL481]